MLFTKVVAGALIGAALLTTGCGSKGADSHAAPSSSAADTVHRTPEQDSLIARADRARIQGSATAPVWIIEVSDFQCPFCRQFHQQTYPTILKDYVQTGKVRFAYINFPIPSLHRNAWPAALAAMCVAAQGKFWPMHDSLFNAQDRWESGDPSPVIDSLAASLGLDMKSYHNCVSSQLMRPLIQADKDRAESRGVNSTPTFLIGDTTLVGAQPIGNFRQVLDSMLAKTAAKGG
ncbi:MAG TPA: thioredoxin domain-containing protein [Gemmatimonadaceae bacterium]|nr:thioredoxin domain-containing protein [Gemmatimonadaceae bacterium]